VRRPEEILVVVHRPGAEREFLVLERSPERQGYRHVVAGALAEGEDAPAAARRELYEETGLEASVVELGRTYRYSLEDEPPEVRARFDSDVAEVAVSAFAVEAPPGWEPALDEEHVGYRWCTREEALELLRYPEPRDALELVADLLVESQA
jgi:8-oxo-dGTP pyrophosphatase MutT (NUDIX family)